MMNYKAYCYIIFLALCCTGCHSIKVNHTKMHTAVTNPIALGVIGLQKGDVYASDFQVTAIPEYKTEIRVQITKENFNRTTFDTYLKAAKGNEHKINYVDSLEAKPQFVILELLDRVALMAEIEEAHNTKTLRYIKSQKETGIVTSVSLAISQELIQELDNADVVFLKNSAYKQYQLSLVKEGETYKTIDFAKTSIFGYTLSYFCWRENDKRQITLADIIDEKSSCSKNTYRDAEKALENMNYFKL